MQHRKMFSVAPTSVEEEVNDSDYEASDQVAIKLVGRQGYVLLLSGTVILS